MAESSTEAWNSRMALEEYQTIHTTCFQPVSKEVVLLLSSRPIQDISPEYKAKLNSRSITSIKAGVRKGKVDDILEYGIRYFLFIG
jgi:hypothetical protein